MLDSSTGGSCRYVGCRNVTRSTICATVIVWFIPVSSEMAGSLPYASAFSEMLRLG